MYQMRMFVPAMYHSQRHHEHRRVCRPIRPQGKFADSQSKMLSTSLRTARHSALRVTTRGYHQIIIDHYETPRNVGSLDKNDINVGTGLVGAPACGDVMKLQVKVGADGKVEEAVFKVRCTQTAPRPGPLAAYGCRAVYLLTAARLLASARPLGVALRLRARRSRRSGSRGRISTRLARSRTRSSRITSSFRL